MYPVRGVYEPWGDYGNILISGLVEHDGTSWLLVIECTAPCEQVQGSVPFGHERLWRSVLRDEGPIGRPGTARPILALTPCMPFVLSPRIENGRRSK
jgi:hypothetical protein